VLPASFLYSPSGAEQASLTALLPSDDSAFTRLADTALTGSPTLAEALARIDQARAQADRVGAERLPSIGADGNVTGSRVNPGQFGGALPPGANIDSTQISYGANVTARWDLDLFGGLRAQERAANLRVNATEAGAAAVRLALTAEIAASVIDYRTLARRAAEIQRDVAAANELARLGGVRERAGIAPGFDRVRAEAQAAASRSRLEALASERVRLIGRLATLTASGGADVRAALTTPAPDVALPPPPPTTPSLLLVNRPDVQRAAAALLAADADLAATARPAVSALHLVIGVGAAGFRTWRPVRHRQHRRFAGCGGCGTVARLWPYRSGCRWRGGSRACGFRGLSAARITALGDAEAPMA
jgi:outer membrane protein TolC